MEVSAFIHMRRSIVSASTIFTSSVSTPGIDNLFIDIKYNDFALNIGCVYRPRACVHDANLISHLLRIADMKNTFIAGDFNLPVMMNLIFPS